MDQCDLEEPADVVRALRGNAGAIEGERGASEQQEKSRTSFADNFAGCSAETQSRSTITHVLRPRTETLIRPNALVVPSLRVHNVAHLQAQASQGAQLFRTQDAPDFHLRVDSHAQLRGLRRGEFVNSLFDEVLVCWFSVQGLIECDVCFAHAAVGALSFVAAFSHDAADGLTLIGREAKLLDRIRVQSRFLLGRCKGYRSEDD